MTGAQAIVAALQAEGVPFVAGYPGQFAILARRKGDTWYLAGVNGSFATELQPLDARKEFSVTMLPLGGFVATLKPLR